MLVINVLSIIFLVAVASTVSAQPYSYDVGVVDIGALPVQSYILGTSTFQQVCIDLLLYRCWLAWGLVARAKIASLALIFSAVCLSTCAASMCPNKKHFAGFQSFMGCSKREAAKARPAGSLSKLHCDCGRLMRALFRLRPASQCDSIRRSCQHHWQ